LYRYSSLHRFSDCVLDPRIDLFEFRSATLTAKIEASG
jgi:hypothetical protein